MVTPQLFNDDLALKEWFYVYYIKWMEVAENGRWMAEGRGIKNPLVWIPLMPFGQQPAEPFHYLLTALIDAQLCKVAHKPTHRYGGVGNMATIIVDPPSSNPSGPVPFVMFEEVDGGIVTDYRMYPNVNWPTAARQLQIEGFDTAGCYRKFVHTSFLRQIYELHQQWLTDSDNARYLIGFAVALFKALDKKKANVDPRPPMLANLLAVKKQIKVGDIDVGGTLLKYAHLMPNLIIEGRGGDMFIDLGGRFNLVLTDVALLSLLDCFKFNNTLPTLSSSLIAFASQGLQRGWIKIDGVRWMSKLSAVFLRRRIRSLPQKVALLTKIMGNPFRLMLSTNNKGVVITLKDGLPESINPAVFPSDPTDLRGLWLHNCEKHGFIHLAARPRGGELSLQLSDQLDYYPQNDFVKYIMRKGALQFLFGLVFPFLSD